MEHKRQRYQFGWIDRKRRRKSPDVWVLRYRETLASGEIRIRSMLIGSVKQYPTESQARSAAAARSLSINTEARDVVPVTFGAVIQRYFDDEIPERHSTSSRYRCWIKNHIEPKWRDYPLQAVKPLAVEDWLKRLNLAPKSKAHLKNLMHILFNAAMRWELLPY